MKQKPLVQAYVMDQVYDKMINEEGWIAPYYSGDGIIMMGQQKGTLVVGITEFAPMDYKDENGQWIGFDADLAKLVAERLGVEIQFVVIDWGQKINELDSKAIDLVWNGMTLTDGVTSAMACTNAYCKNAQVVVVRGQ